VVLTRGCAHELQGLRRVLGQQHHEPRPWETRQRHTRCSSAGAGPQEAARRGVCACVGGLVVQVMEYICISYAGAAPHPAPARSLWPSRGSSPPHRHPPPPYTCTQPYGERAVGAYEPLTSPASERVCVMVWVVRVSCSTTHRAISTAVETENMQDAVAKRKLNKAPAGPIALRRATGGRVCVLVRGVGGAGRNTTGLSTRPLRAFCWPAPYWGSLVVGEMALSIHFVK
jgi:hypothetical protein